MMGGILYVRLAYGALLNTIFLKILFIVWKQEVQEHLSDSQLILEVSNPSFLSIIVWERLL